MSSLLPYIESALRAEAGDRDVGDTPKKVHRDADADWHPHGQRDIPGMFKERRINLIINTCVLIDKTIPPIHSRDVLPSGPVYQGGFIANTTMQTYIALAANSLLCRSQRSMAVRRFRNGLASSMRIPPPTRNCTSRKVSYSVSVSLGTAEVGRCLTVLVLYSS